MTEIGISTDRLRRITIRQDSCYARSSKQILAAPSPFCSLIAFPFAHRPDLTFFTHLRDRLHAHSTFLALPSVTMGASDLPYLYDRASNRTSVAYPSNDFNPKAVTEASYTRLSTQSIPKPKHEGPLINFNQHPDSYVVVSGAQTEHKALPPSTKKAIVSVRWVQFALRLVQESVALGLLVATICIKGTSGAETYLLRIPVSPPALPPPTPSPPQQTNIMPNSKHGTPV